MRAIAISMVVGGLLVAPFAGAGAQPQQSPGAGSPSAAGSSGRSTGVEVAASTLIGAKVRDPQGKELGSVSQLMIEPQQGKVTSVVIKQGGTLGMGGHEMAVPWDAVKVQRDGTSVVVTVQQQVLEQAPRDQGRQGGEPSASPSGQQPRR
jgi:sporulation protein YlmC with PRC-barrel domain